MAEANISGIGHLYLCQVAKINPLLFDFSIRVFEILECSIRAYLYIYSEWHL